MRMLGGAPHTLPRMMKREPFSDVLLRLLKPHVLKLTSPMFQAPNADGVSSTQLSVGSPNTEHHLNTLYVQ